MGDPVKPRNWGTWATIRYSATDGLEELPPRFFPKASAKESNISCGNFLVHPDGETTHKTEAELANEKKISAKKKENRKNIKKSMEEYQQELLAKGISNENARKALMLQPLEKSEKKQASTNNKKSSPNDAHSATSQQSSAEEKKSTDSEWDERVAKVVETFRKLGVIID